MNAYWPTVDRLWCRHDTGVDGTAVVEQLQVADAATLAELTSTALRSTAEALRANLALLFVLLRPFLWIVYYVLRWIADYLYHHGLDQWQAMVMGWWRWERRLTPRQHWYQVIGLTASVALYHVHRQGYLAKVYHRARALQRRLRNVGSAMMVFTYTSRYRNAHPKLSLPDLSLDHGRYSRSFLYIGCDASSCLVLDVGLVPDTVDAGFGPLLGCLDRLD